MAGGVAIVGSLVDGSRILAAQHFNNVIFGGPETVIREEPESGPESPSGRQPGPDLEVAITLGELMGGGQLAGDMRLWSGVRDRGSGIDGGGRRLGFDGKHAAGGAERLIRLKGAPSRNISRVRKPLPLKIAKIAPVVPHAPEIG